MKKLVLGCMAAIILSATAISASKHQPLQMNANSYAPATDTIPGDTSRWNNSRRDTSMNPPPTMDTIQRNRPDSTQR